MTEINLSNGKVAVVDDADIALVNRFRWHSSGNGYARSSGNPQTTMHRLIMQPPPGFEVDHIDGNGLNNQRANLRVVDRRLNCLNRHVSRGFSRYKGVTFDTYKGKWKAEIKAKTKTHLGYFETEKEASAAYYGAAKVLMERYEEEVEDLVCQDRAAIDAARQGGKGERNA